MSCVPNDETKAPTHGHMAWIFGQHILSSVCFCVFLLGLPLVRFRHAWLCTAGILNKGEKENFVCVCVCYKSA